MDFPVPQPALAPRVTRSYSQTIHASPQQVFPLLCPVMEARWLKDWRHELIHSESGLAEPGAVFATPHPAGRTLWIITIHDPNKRIGFARWQPDDLVVELDIRLEPIGADQTRVNIRYVWTATGPAASAAMDNLTEQAWRDNMIHWERSMNEWFANEARQATATC